MIAPSTSMGMLPLKSEPSLFGRIFSRHLTILCHRRIVLRRNPLRLLFVDQSRGDYLLTQEHLKDFPRPTDITWVDSGEKALAFLQGAAPFRDAVFPDMLLIDPLLPRIDGWQVIEHLRLHGYPDNILVVVMATLPTEPFIHHCLDLHVDALIEKPVTAALLYQLLDSMEEKGATG